MKSIFLAVDMSDWDWIYDSDNESEGNVLSSPFKRQRREDELVSDSSVDDKTRDRRVLSSEATGDYATICISSLSSVSESCDKCVCDDCECDQEDSSLFKEPESDTTLCDFSQEPNLGTSKEVTLSTEIEDIHSSNSTYVSAGDRREANSSNTVTRAHTLVFLISALKNPIPNYSTPKPNLKQLLILITLTL